MNMEQSALQQERQLAWMRQPSCWLHHPFLSLTRRRDEEKSFEVAVLYDASANTDSDGMRTTVFLLDVRAAKRKVRSEADLLAQPHIRYASLDDVYAAGWRVY